MSSPKIGLQFLSVSFLIQVELIPICAKGHAVRHLCDANVFIGIPFTFILSMRIIISELGSNNMEDFNMSVINKRLLYLPIVFYLFIAGNIRANDVEQPRDKSVLTENHSSFSGDSHNVYDLVMADGQQFGNITFTEITTDSAGFKTLSGLMKVSIDSISVIIEKKSPKIARGLLIGMAGGAVIGAYAGRSVDQSDSEAAFFSSSLSVIAGVFVGGVVGGGLGTAAEVALGKDKVHDLSKLGKEQKRRVLIYLKDE